MEAKLYDEYKQLRRQGLKVKGCGLIFVGSNC